MKTVEKTSKSFSYLFDQSETETEKSGMGIIGHLKMIKENMLVMVGNYNLI
jgi:hypothetical protein